MQVVSGVAVSKKWRVQGSQSEPPLASSRTTHQTHANPRFLEEDKGGGLKG